MLKRSPLISIQELLQILQSPTLRVIDCRYDLANPAWGQENYIQAHIPGAIFADLKDDLAAPVTPSTGRHPLPDPQSFSDSLAGWGITPDTRVVVYDTNSGGFAGRLWWMLRAFGHSNVQLLDGSFSLWQGQNLPVATGLETIQPTSFHYKPEFDRDQYLTSQEVFSALQDPNIRLVDARASERFQGLSETIDPVAGHIPGALNRFYGADLTSAGVFKPAEKLKQEFTSLLGEKPSQQVVVYCGSGVTSCHLLIAMEIAGMPPAKIYLGSWSEWIRDPARPIATGK